MKIPQFPLDSQEFRLSMMAFFGVCAVVGILPFALWRFSQGEWIIGALEVVTVIGLAGAIVVARRYQRVDEVARFMVVLTYFACVLLGNKIGGLILFWSYAVLIGNLLLAGRSLGLFASLALIATLAFMDSLFASTAERITYVITGLLVSMYAYVFAITTDSQRDRLESMATFDELTGAGNRRMMQIDLAERFAHAVRHHLPYAIAIVDLDHFKAVNDTHGHEAGDEVLKQFVALAQQVMRADDRLYRMGGEEFVMFLPHTGHVGLLAFLDRLQAHLRPSLTGPGGPVTVSIGAAVMQDGDPDWMAWLARADRAMYRAKNEGRDRLCIAPGGWVEAEGDDLEKDAA